MAIPSVVDHIRAETQWICIRSLHFYVGLRWKMDGARGFQDLPSVEVWSNQISVNLQQHPQQSHKQWAPKITACTHVSKHVFGTSSSSSSGSKKSCCHGNCRNPGSTWSMMCTTPLVAKTSGVSTSVGPSQGTEKDLAKPPVVMKCRNWVETLSYHMLILNKWIYWWTWSYLCSFSG